MSKNLNLSSSLFHNGMPTFFMFVGIPGCGKSTIAEEIKKSSDREIKIHSSDALRKELFGDEDVQDKNAELFNELHTRIKNDLRNGFDVIYDATNINRKRRYGFLQELKNIPCLRVCICVVTPYELCLKFNAERTRNVPIDVIKRMYMNWQPPEYSEGFDNILLCGVGLSESNNDWSITTLVEKMKDFDQENSHHALTLGEHCSAAQKYIDENYPDNHRLSIAALLHDNGKIFTKTHINARGEDDGDCHYYQHHSVGAYDSILYLFNEGYETNDIIYISNLIYFHMHPYMSWKQSKSVERRTKIMLGEDLYDDIMKLHEADLAAH